MASGRIAIGTKFTIPIFTVVMIAASFLELVVAERPQRQHRQGSLLAVELRSKMIGANTSSKESLADDAHRQVQLALTKLTNMDPESVIHKLPSDIAVSIRDFRSRPNAREITSPQCAHTGAEPSHQALLYMDKYVERSRAGQCEDDRGMWAEHDTQPTRIYKYLAMAKVLDLDNKDRVLDWGTGCGKEFDLAAQKYGFEAVGVDAVRHNVMWASSNLRRAKFCLADATELPFANNTFDAVVSNGALYHVNGIEHEKAAMQEVVRVLVPGGCAWMSFLGGRDDPVGQELWNGASIDGAVVGTVDERHLWDSPVEYDQAKIYSLVGCKNIDNTVA